MSPLIATGIALLINLGWSAVLGRFYPKPYSMSPANSNPTFLEHFVYFIFTEIAFRCMLTDYVILGSIFFILINLIGMNLVNEYRFKITNESYGLIYVSHFFCVIFGIFNSYFNFHIGLTICASIISFIMTVSKMYTKVNNLTINYVTLAFLAYNISHCYLTITYGLFWSINLGLGEVIVDMIHDKLR